MTRFQPHVTHRIEDPSLVDELVSAGHGIGLLPMNWPCTAGTRVVALPQYPVTMTTYAAFRRGRRAWAPPAALIDRVAAASVRGAFQSARAARHGRTQ
ncbi:LysR substrate-binding domain-containing protein [Mycobacterium aquaticum]|uniref:LysR substrate-binding domain-containing protein n=1 Tax=Mycobacterium aquaticum TaxID=1927124 RepID=A0A1X0B0P2_9MYCO|nr:hypothetical protein BST13_12875 [Mycobacterium aquaticum]